MWIVRLALDDLASGWRVKVIVRGVAAKVAWG
jgi:hypothetical protein